MGEFDILYKSIKNGYPILGVGAVSINVVNATIELANELKIPLILLSSRRQVECREFGGGYVWFTEEYVRYVRSKDVGKFIFLERDHGGPGQGTLSIRQDDHMLSYQADSLLGFDILHFDYSKLSSIDFDEILRDMSECQSYSHNGLFEMGSEDGAGTVSDLEKFRNMISVFNKDKCKFFVCNTGLQVKECENVGEIDSDFVKKIVDICNYFGCYFRAHNADYISHEQMKSLKDLGVHSINIAPELGVAETKTFLIFMDREGGDRFLQISYDSGSWKKWLKQDSKCNDYIKAIISGHYVFKHPEVVEIKNKLRYEINLDKILKDRIKEILKERLGSLGWKVS